MCTLPRHLKILDDVASCLLLEATKQNLNNEMKEIFISGGHSYQMMSVVVNKNVPCGSNALHLSCMHYSCLLQTAATNE